VLFLDVIDARENLSDSSKLVYRKGLLNGTASLVINNLSNSPIAKELLINEYLDEIAIRVKIFDQTLDDLAEIPDKTIFESFIGKFTN